MIFKYSVLWTIKFFICYATLKSLKEAQWVKLNMTMCIVREPKWSHEAYIRLDFLPIEHKLLPTCNIKQDA